jgi:hypothetical protein
MKKPKLTDRKNRPSYTISVRLGMDTIARRTTPIDKFEKAALAWIADTKWWHANRQQPRRRREYAEKAAKKEAP